MRGKSRICPESGRSIDAGKHQPLKLLIIEEEKGSSRLLIQYLRRENYRCDLSYDPADLPVDAPAAGYDCILLSCGHSDFMGLRMLGALRERAYGGGIIVLSFLSSPEARIIGLDAGADDYMSHPVHLGELTARIAALIRRKNFAGNRVLTVNELSIDLSGNLVTVKQQPLELTRKEFDLLLYLASHPNKVLSKEAIATNLVEEQDLHGDIDFIYAHIKNLKKKLAAAGCRDYISSVYGMGYKFVV